MLFEGEALADKDLAADAERYYESMAAERELVIIPADADVAGKLATRYSNSALGEIEVSHASETTIFDFGGGHADYKRMFGTRVSESGHVWLLRPGLRSKMIMNYFNGRRAITQSARRTLGKLGLLGRLRKITRRGLK